MSKRLENALEKIQKRNKALIKAQNRGRKPIVHSKLTDETGRPLDKWEVIKLVMNRLQMGDTDEDARMFLMAKHSLSESTSLLYVNEAKACIVQKMEQYREGVAKRNIRRLDTIINESYDKGDLNTALKAIDILNKMGGVYYQNINVHSDAPIFQIKIGNDT